MKKFGKIFAAALLTIVAVIAACMCFVGCSSSDSGSGSGETREEWSVYNGTYKFEKAVITSSMDLGGQTYDSTVTVNVGEAYSGVTFTENYMVLTLKTNGKATFTTELADAGANSKSEYKWSAEGKKITLETSGVTAFTFTVNGETIEYFIDMSTSGTTLTETIYLKKAA